MTDLQSLIVASIKTCVAESPLNRLTGIDSSPIWDEPLVGFADGDDPLFNLYKTAVGEFHLTPRQALAAHTGAGQPQTPHVAVVSWVLPTAGETKRSNWQMDEGPSLRWNHTRFQGEEFNDSLRRHVVALLEERGYLAAAPVIGSQFKTLSVSNGMASTWSERHIAHAAGLGTFSLSDGLITARGIAHRCGSVVFNAECAPTPRPYTHYQEYCPYLMDGSCGVCMQRCPVGAIGPDGHDKLKCREYLMVTLVEWVKKPGYMGAYSACGLCQTYVPCGSQIPSHKTT